MKQGAQIITCSSKEIVNGVEVGLTQNIKIKRSAKTLVQSLTMDKFIKARLERAEQYLNNALNHSKGDGAEVSSAGWTRQHIIDTSIKAALEQFKRIEKYIHQCQKDQKENEKYHSIIE